ncbi:unnamed protein product [Symbiodinium natans]|uniref:Uncharacterized protein n=1 Tax=Symbiodinium natans TaxID=878477 RepID=A0A812QXA1_9DINO|nr:unnamed protein product [Symbiodinium natans]
MALSPSGISHKSWMQVSAFVVGSFGPVATLATMEPYSAPARFTLDLLAWKFGTMSFRDPTTRFLSALTGGFLFGWGMTLHFLASKVYDKAPEETRQAVVGGLCCWFCLDSTGSVASGNPVNVLFNIGVLLLSVGPMWWPEQREKKQ